MHSAKHPEVFSSGCSAARLHVKITKGALSGTAAQWRQICALSVENTDKCSPRAALMARTSTLLVRTTAAVITHLKK